MMDFPSSPTNGQAANGYIWNGYAWVSDIPAGGGTPGGSNTQIQFNDTGAFGGDSGLIYDKVNGQLTVHWKAGGYGSGGLKAVNDSNGANFVLQPLAPGGLYITDAAGAPTLLALGIWANPWDGSTFSNSTGAWTLSSGRLILNDTTASTTTTTGALTIAGGMGVAGALRAGSMFVGADAVWHAGNFDPTTKAPLASPTFTGDPKAPTPTVGDNDTSIATTAFVTTAVGTKEPTIAAGTTAQYWRGDKSFQTLDKTAVGLANVDNTSDANKPVSTAGAAADALRVLKTGDTMSGALSITDTTTSSSATTGALKVAGGAGIAGALYVGGGLGVTGDATVSGKAAVGDGTAVQFVQINGGNTGTASGASLNVLLAGVTNIAIGNKSAVLGAAFNATPLIYATSEIEVHSGAPLSIANTTASSSSTTGAFKVAGGVGIAGIAHIGGKVHCNGSNAAWGVVSAGTSMKYAGTSTEYGLAMRPVADTTTAIFFLNAAGSQCGAINTTATTTVLVSGSDGRSKDKLKPIDSGRLIDRLEAWSFRWKVNGERDYGVIAQDAAKVLPQAAHYEPKMDQWGVDYAKFVPILLAEVKALRARLAKLERRP